MSILFWGLVSGNAVAQPGNLEVRVNSNRDRVAADEELTLREAIAILNGALPLEELSNSEQALVTPANGSRISFNLPPGQTKIELEEELPAIATPGVLLDGTSQAGYDKEKLESSEIPVPVVVITPTPGKQIARGLIIAADNTTVRGLSVYGFSNPSNPLLQSYQDLITPGRVTAKTPPGDIFITHRTPPEIRILRGVPEGDFPFDDDGKYDIPPKNVVIENNYLGSSEVRSAFGVYVFDGIDATIQRNRIAYHSGSAIVTSVRANNLKIQGNVLENNGSGGMPDAIRLEGVVGGTAIADNIIRNNAGSGIYVFKPDGAVEIRNNEITNNGQRYKRAAIFLTGSRHQVTGNRISTQPGPGVAVAVFPDGDRIKITNNQFSNLQGLNIDLVAQQRTGVQDYQSGDGRNPLLGLERVRQYGQLVAGYTGDSFFTRERRRQIANYGVNAPQFASREFYLTPSGTATVLGRAEPGAEIEMYRISENSGGEGVMSVPIGKTTADETGQFRIVLEGVRSGDKLSATATHPEWGTSEDAIAVQLRALPGTSSMGGGR
ncbi:right-handed parallel beta-helix repeat-containing protein [Oscillatoria sp. FACHB-1406]|uniref:right-handed parallel beta-helix repeat-containing protein n=1 Tax=Oscillatoria sp. FACHB-1406 TaxID=2692846 RepID=UPI0016872956|nr:right-handed parallel beta-helix repeat-containing protein [Oscillatoria sp. FACHB-1406]MBD2577137.1 right-handed parallel beta-helix repeat-containing protein [Oscillatoria sp. FACHB-1406]